MEQSSRSNESGSGRPRKTKNEHISRMMISFYRRRTMRPPQSLQIISTSTKSPFSILTAISTRLLLVLAMLSPVVVSIPIHTQHELKNPFANGGCLYQRWKHSHPQSRSYPPSNTNQSATIPVRIRVCNSEDPPLAAKMGYCRDDDPFDYMELRIHGQNWEASIFQTWVLQILLSEVLHVPTSVETGYPNAHANFYDMKDRLDFDSLNHDDWKCLENGVENGDCRILQQQQQRHYDDDNDYQSCCHFIPEVWEGTDFDYQMQMGRMEPPQPMGTMGEEQWFLAKFTAQRDPSLLSYVGLQGPGNRQKVAERFSRPTTWKDYCMEVSPTECRNDTIAVRAPKMSDPEDQLNADRFFVENIYQGHFRKTSKNDCISNPSTCTGHIFNYPCSWHSPVTQQAYHLDIAVEGDGTSESRSGGAYSYGQLVDAIQAANATQSDILLYWWTPESLYQRFIGTDMEFTKITLPPVTQECLDHRIPENAQCSPILAERVGDPRGACGEAPQALKKVIGAGLYDVTYNSGIPKALQSPGYETLRTFQISGAETGELFDYWVSQSDGNPREAVCDWVLENFDRLRTFIPRTYPRVIVQQDGTLMKTESSSRPSIQALPFISTLVAWSAMGTVVAAAIMTYRQRKRPVMQFVQLEFLVLLLLGLLTVSVGALLTSFPPTNGLCVTAIWLTNFGYTLELVPLNIKMAAICRLMRAAKRLKQVTLNRRSLFGAVVFLSALVIFFLILWTTLDPPQLHSEYKVTDAVTANQEVIVEGTYYCESDSAGWRYTSVAWHLSLLVVATIQAFQTRRIRREINESQTLAIMIYSHFMFVLLRIVTLFLEQSLSETHMMHMRSIIYSLDCFVTINLYFVPKFLSDDSKYEQSQHMIESQTVKQLRMLAAIATAQHERQSNRMERQESSTTRRNRPSLRLSLPPEDFKAHLRGVDPATYAAAMTDPSSSDIEEAARPIALERSLSMDAATVAGPSCAPRQCRHCGRYD